MPIADTFSTSTSLLNQVRGGEQIAWFRFAHLYTPLIVHWSRQQGIKGGDIEDIVQNVLSAVAQNIDQFGRDRSDNTFRGWLWTITRSKVNDHFRIVMKQPKSFGQDFANDVAALEVDAESLGDSVRERAILIASALQVIQGDFSERTWTAFWLTVPMGQRTKDVAEELGMTSKAVCMCRARVMQRLRETLGLG